MKKYSVYDAVWLAAALLTIEKYDNDPSVGREGIYFKQADIIHLAEKLTNEKVDPARVSWWVNADNDKASRNYLRSDMASNPSARRISMLEEFPVKSYPEDLDLNDELIINEKQYTVGNIMDFLREKYPTILSKMPAGYDIQAIMKALKNTAEMDPDQHDGCYELMRETINAYSKLQNYSSIDYKDLNLVYLTTVGTFRQGINSKKQMVNKSHLLEDDKKYLEMLWDEVWEKAGQGRYENFEPAAKEERSIGIFGTGFFSFERTTTDEHAQAFIRMCIDMLHMTDDEEMFDCASKVLTDSFQGMKAASASMILHCLKPYTFPVLNTNSGHRNIFEVLGVKLNKPDSLGKYIENCRAIKAFRDENFTCKNYRIYDIAAQEMEKYLISQHFRPSSEEYPVNLSKDDWKRFIQEIESPKHRGCMRVLSCFVDIDGIASANI